MTALLLSLFFIATAFTSAAPNNAEWMFIYIYVYVDILENGVRIIYKDNNVETGQL